jgi:uncharacterized Zn finger protein
LPKSVKKPRETHKPRKTTPPKPYDDLTWADLEGWAGTRIVSRGKNYQREGNVRDLALTPEGGLVAWVKGARRYATLVKMGKSGRLDCECTCPFEGNCKHAVAVVLEYLAFQKAGKAVPLVDGEDERLDILEEWVNEEDTLDMDSDAEKARGLSSTARNQEIESYLSGKSKDALIKLVGDLRNRFPEISTALSDEIQLKAGRTKPLIDRIKREIREISSEPGWRNHWDNDGYTPDYSVIRKNLETLLAAGQADQVLTLGKALMKAGTQQVGMSHDDGETAMEIGGCLPVIVKALDQSSLKAEDKLSWVLETVLQDEYSLFDDLAEYLHRKHPATAWNTLADRLLERLRRFKPAPDREYEFSWKSDRDQLSQWVIHALERAGRPKEIISLLEAEAPITGSYERLVRFLSDANRLAEAEKWVFRGIKDLGNKRPGITSHLRGQLLDIRKKEKNWPAVAALQVYEFIVGPSENTFAAAEKAAEKIKLWPVVRSRLMVYLETGTLPWDYPKWPLPSTKLNPPERNRHDRFPLLSHLVTVAIYEKTADQVIRWYDLLVKQDRGGFGGSDDRVAEAVRIDYPDRAVAIWKKIAEGEIAQVKPRAYQAAAVYLRKIARFLKERKKGKEWEGYLKKLRQTHARKSSLMAVLDTLEGKPILKI